MATPSFEDVLDQCLDEVRAGRLTVAQCLERCPQHAAALEPELRALLAVSELAVPASTPDPARRAAFMAALRETPQDKPRRPWASFALPRLSRFAAVFVPATAVAVAALVLVLGRGGSSAEASTLTMFAGHAERAEGSDWVPLQDGASLPVGTRLRTDEGGRALVTFVDGSTVALDPQTEVTIERAQAGRRREIALEQSSGRLWSQVAHDDRANSSFTVRTADATVVARGTVFETAIANGETAVSTAEGAVEVQTVRERIRVAAGDAVRARLQSVLPRATARASAPAALTVSEAFVASLIGPDGRATGALPDGSVYQQIPGALTSDPGSGPQRLVLGDVASGEYTLIVRRVELGAGTLLVQTEGRERALPLAAGAETYTLRLRVTATAAQTVVAFEGGVQVTPTDGLTLRERLVITERARQALERLREQRQAERQRRQQQQAQPTFSVTPVLRPQVTPTVPVRLDTAPTSVPTRVAPVVTPTQVAPEATLAPARTTQPSVRP